MLINSDTDTKEAENVGDTNRDVIETNRDSEVRFIMQDDHKIDN